MAVRLEWPVSRKIVWRDSLLWRRAVYFGNENIEKVRDMSTIRSSLKLYLHIADLMF
jgi:hypothetical protein